MQQTTQEDDYESDDADNGCNWSNEFLPIMPPLTGLIAFYRFDANNGRLCDFRAYTGVHLVTFFLLLTHVFSVSKIPLVIKRGVFRLRLTPAYEESGQSLLLAAQDRTATG